MSKSKYINAAFAVTVALPTLVTPAAANTQSGVAKSEGTIIVAQTTTKKLKKRISEKTKERKAKSELRSALKRMPAAEKTKMGAARYNKLRSLSGNELVRAGCFTHGVGCGGTPQFSQGVLCCAIIKTTI